MRSPVISAVALLVLSGPALSDRLAIDIDDDGWTVVAPAGEPALVVDIEDDGWTVVTAPTVSRRSGTASADAGCTQLEASAGLRGEACGTLDRAAVIRALGDD